MAIGLESDFSARLWEALKASRTPLGEGLASEARSPVPADVEEAFLQLLEGSNDADFDAEALPDRAFLQDVRTADPLGAERSELTERTLEAQSGASSVAQTAPEAVMPSPVELYRLQFSLSMHLFESKALSGVRDHAAADLKQTLKSAE